MDLKERNALGDAADTHWYYVSKARMVARILPGTQNDFLDVGAGLGWFSRWFLENGYGQSAVCVDPGYDADSEETLGNGKTISYVRSIGENSSNVVLLMDVLEHVDDDVALLQDYWDKAEPGTVFVITVPAFEFLWSAHDDYLDHRRRYTRARLDQTIHDVGGTPDRLYYYFGTIFPIACVVRLLSRNRTADSSDMRPAPKLVNSFLTAVCGLEARLARWNTLAGLSVVARFQKPES